MAIETEGETPTEMLTRTISDNVVRLDVVEIRPGDTIIAHFPAVWPMEVIQVWIEQWWETTGLPNGVMVLKGEVGIEVHRPVDDDAVTSPTPDNEREPHEQAE